MKTKLIQKIKEEFIRSENGDYLVELCNSCPITNNQALNHSLYCHKRGYKNFIKIR